jgi:hypothetical protein
MAHVDVDVDGDGDGDKLFMKLPNVESFGGREGYNAEEDGNLYAHTAIATE